ncbi:hypothetical protein SDC9_89459 [bioreactor metagenome]|uniref:Uncharacterized protein n=1 Tax=bioreactor metagenome TaxID=1076179 RepID=A0A644ZQY4_9ZZZZ
MEHNLVLIIAKIKVCKTDVSGQFSIGCRTVRLLIFPRPDTCAYFALTYYAGLFFVHIHQRNKPLILFWLFVDDLKNSLGSGKCCQDGIKLLADLRNRVRKRACILQESSNCSDVHPVVNDHYRSDGGCKGIIKIGKVTHDWHHDIGISIGIGRNPAKIFV